MAESRTLDSPFDLLADREAVTARVRASGTSFFWAMRFLPKDKREAIFAVYAFCREVDDIADGETMGAEQKREQLAAWRAEIERLYQDRPTREVTRALLEPVHRYGLEKDAFLAIIDGMQMDADGPIRAPSFAELELYCARVAGAVGLLCVRIFGMAGAEGKRLSETLGRALQLTNILRDLHEDAMLGRLYLPRELLEGAGILSHDPLIVLQHRSLPFVARKLGAEARRSFAEARAIILATDPAIVRPARIMMEVYAPALGRLEREDFANVGAPRSSGTLHGAWSKAEKLAIALRYALF
jgi:phytoene synthase